MTSARPVNHIVGLHSIVSDCMSLTYQQFHVLTIKKHAERTFGGKPPGMPRGRPSAPCRHGHPGEMFRTPLMSRIPGEKSLFAVFLA